jgi:pimeloyl-ACP methyl ester carboxylesterase
MGALVIGQYALRYPGRVAAVVAVDGFLQPPPGPAPPSDSAPLTLEVREQIINGMFVPETPAALRATILEMMLEPSNERAMAVGAAMKTFSPTSDDSVNVPALGLAAEKNFALESAMSQRLNARTERLSGTGHFPMMEKPLAFNARLREFLDEIDF